MKETSLSAMKYVAVFNKDIKIKNIFYCITTFSWVFIFVGFEGK